MLLSLQDQKFVSKLLITSVLFIQHSKFAVNSNLQGDIMLSDDQIELMKADRVEKVLH